MTALSLPDPASTEALGARLAGVLAPRDVVFLRGQLGAGKTTLARGLIGAWTGGDEEAPSPTYTLVQTYEGPAGPLWHLDLYRLKSPEEALELGFEEGLDEALMVIEWPERLGVLTPADRIEIALIPAGAGRIAEVSGYGRHAGFTLDA
ncbi:MAG TPA: tRNA (adenosine(37)-N6)-threonylcarbamoyltransferase complex ATPase subunit type 1 TsaE [Caulobacterales bacterium]|nr:tRNA (adenosine(37)-N6)-threonylcarbamoyltransferase complex ATPase subunit type 1 TsaE [Caulobacterales bacterium]